MARVVVVGDIVTDVLAVYSGPIAEGSDTPARIAVAGGGSAANTAAWLATLGVAVGLVGVVGADPPGDMRLAELTAAGVDCRAVRRRADAPTGTVIVLARGDERTMLTDRGANALLSASDVSGVDAAWTDAGHLHLSGYALLDPRTAPAGRHALAEAARRGLTTSVDASSAEPLRRTPAFLDWVRGVDLLLANVDEARVLVGPGGLGTRASGASATHGGPGEAAALAVGLARVARHAVVKRGPDGAVWAGTDGTVVSAPASPAARAVDATGAGDAFAAGLLAAWFAGDDPATALAAATRLGARAVSLLGARPPARPPDQRRS